jgi:hypothetical protein
MKLVQNPAPNCIHDVGYDTPTVDQNIRKYAAQERANTAADVTNSRHTAHPTIHAKNSPYWTNE